MSMLDPSIDELQEKIRSKYTLVTLSARRAREIRDTTKKSVLEDSKALTYVGMALEEIYAEELTVKEDD